jgi:hypothetical protein
MLLRPVTCNCGRNIGPLFRIAAAKLQDAKFRALPHSGSGNGPLPLLRVQLRLLPPLFITLASIAHQDRSIPNWSGPDDPLCGVWRACLPCRLSLPQQARQPDWPIQPGRLQTPSRTHRLHVKTDWPGATCRCLLIVCTLLPAQQQNASRFADAYRHLWTTDAQYWASRTYAYWVHHNNNSYIN